MITLRFSRQSILPAAVLLLASRTANAQTPQSIALDTFDPAPAGDKLFSVPSPYVKGHAVPHANALFEYAHQPLVVGDGVTTQALVAYQAFLHLGASLSLWDHVLVYANLPIALLQNGESPTLGGISFTSPQDAQVGDLRLGARFRIVGEDDEPFQLGVGTSLYFPTAPEPSFTGDGGFRISPDIVAGGISSHLVWSAVLRPMFRTSSNPATLHHGAGVGYVFGKNRLQISAEYTAITPLQEGHVDIGKGQTIRRSLLSNVEMHLGMRGRIVSGLWAGIACGPGFTDAMGTPQFRLIGMVAWTGPTR